MNWGDRLPINQDTLYSELAANHHHAANRDSQAVPAYQADDGDAKRGAPRSHYLPTTPNAEEDTPRVDSPWNCRRYCGRICRLLHGPKAHCRQADASLSSEQKGLDCEGTHHGDT
ncbi:hypothetical protein VTL71DRAFT_10715 [Oculimacula yallundae]|uniref:Uncharacterized protein n=1 Tax=Oculimacula yallundae TaxID=86028 RepID=A0ABR4CTW4_9HELO